MGGPLFGVTFGLCGVLRAFGMLRAFGVFGWIRGRCPTLSTLFQQPDTVVVVFSIFVLKIIRVCTERHASKRAHWLRSWKRAKPALAQPVVNPI